MSALLPYRPKFLEKALLFSLPALYSLVPTAFDQASSIHARHLLRAEAALALTPPRYDLFWIHSRVCEAAYGALEELKLIPASTLFPIILDGESSSSPSLQPTAHAENVPQQNPEENPPQESES